MGGGYYHHRQFHVSLVADLKGELGAEAPCYRPRWGALIDIQAPHRRDGAEASARSKCRGRP
jgi:hypothetical protein